MPGKCVKTTVECRNRCTSWASANVLFADGK